ncbi:MAG TPA: 2-C-methyl-D-erythritol 4-phosphate cytidylyltransferase [Thermomicrobiales bacterium]|nr:2-C-methyl-D-erythritol 4-phosphate cytidylyltransferase [Thermomicrobiales bacterium]
MQPDTTFVIVAAGRGDRFGHTAKVILPLAGKELLRWSIDAACSAASVGEIVVVAGPHTIDDIQHLVMIFPPARPVSVVIGGATRQESVAAGVAAVGPDSALVLVHDAARPLVTPDLIERCAEAAREHGAAIAAIPVTDTLKLVTGRRIDTTVPRDHLWAAQTPQAFQRPVIDEAIRWARGQTATFTDEASLLEAIGKPVAIVEGSVLNLKVTYPADVRLAGALLAFQEAEQVR